MTLLEWMRAETIRARTADPLAAATTDASLARLLGVSRQRVAQLRTGGRPSLALARCIEEVTAGEVAVTSWPPPRDVLQDRTVSADKNNT